MQDERDEPWDARLVEWMQRGSGRATRHDRNRPGVIEYIGIAVWGGGVSQLFSEHWYPFAICAFLAVALVTIGRRIT